MASCRLIVFVAVLAFVPWPLAAQQSTGARIGGIVTDALNAALPGVGALVKLFRPDKKSDDKQANAEVTAARKVLLADATGRIKQISSVVSELEATNQFLEATVPAANRCSRFLGVLDTSDTAAATQGWSDCQEKLKAITSVSKAVLANVADEAIRLRLAEVQSIVADAQPEIERAVKASNWADAKAQARALTQSLNAVMAISGIEVSRFKAMTESLVQWANQPAGSGVMASPILEKGFLSEATLAVNEARKQISRPR